MHWSLASGISSIRMSMTKEEFTLSTIDTYYSKFQQGIVRAIVGCIPRLKEGAHVSIGWFWSKLVCSMPSMKMSTEVCQHCQTTMSNMMLWGSDLTIGCFWWVLLPCWTSLTFLASIEFSHISASSLAQAISEFDRGSWRQSCQPPIHPSLWYLQHMPILCTQWYLINLLFNGLGEMGKLLHCNLSVCWLCSEPHPMESMPPLLVVLSMLPPHLPSPITGHSTICTHHNLLTHDLSQNERSPQSKRWYQSFPCHIRASMYVEMKVSP